MAAHGGEQERLHARVLPILHRAAHDGGDIVDAAAADADGDARAGLQPRGEIGCRKLVFDLGGDIGNAAAGKFLLDDKQAWKRHKVILLWRPARAEY